MVHGVGTGLVPSPWVRLVRCRHVDGGCLGFALRLQFGAIGTVSRKSTDPSRSFFRVVRFLLGACGGVAWIIFFLFYELSKFWLFLQGTRAASPSPLALWGVSGASARFLFVCV